MTKIEQIIRKQEKPTLRHLTGRMKRLFPKGPKCLNI